ncbi:MAG: WG repeat-containing protein [Flavobacteriales bacterium]
MRNALLVAGLLLGMGAHAGRLEKAFEALKAYNYFLARELFQGQTEKHPAAAWYGLSVITGRQDNPFYQPDSSYHYVLRSAAAFAATAEKERKAIAALGVDEAAITAQKEHVYGLGWSLASALNTVDSYQRFIDTYTGSGRVPEAKKLRDHLAFQDARAKNTAEAYAAFAERYPEAGEIYEARSRLQEAIFREAVPDGSVEQYERFLKEHPESPYVRDAQDQLYKRSTPHRSQGELYGFIRRYPTNPNVTDAWRSLYALYTKDLSAGRITAFLQEYPDYPFMNELVGDFETASLTLYPFRRDGRWGFIDDKGGERIKAEYEFVEPFVNGQAQVGRDGHVGTINKSGKEVVPLRYDDVLDFSDGLATVELGDSAGVVDRSGQLVVPLRYADIGEYVDGRAYAVRNGRHGFIDGAGNTVVPFDYDGANTYRNGVAVVKKGDRSGVIDSKGNVVVPFQYDRIEGFDGPTSRVTQDGRMGLISLFGDVLLPAEHDHVGAFSNGLVLVIDKGKCGYVGRDGHFVVPQQYEANAATPDLGDFHQGVARVLVNGKLGLIDTLGTKVFPPQYADIGLMESDAIPVKKKAKWGYARRNFSTLVEARYDQAWEFHEGHARVKVGELFGVVDSTGKEAIVPKYLKLADKRDGVFIATLGTGTGVVDPKGHVLVPLVYDAVEPVDGIVVKVTRGQRIGYVRVADGRVLWKEEGFDAPSAGSAE